MITETLFVGGKDHQVEEINNYISSSVLGAIAELATRKPKTTKVIIR